MCMLHIFSESAVTFGCLVYRRSNGSNITQSHSYSIYSLSECNIYTTVLLDWSEGVDYFSLTAALTVGQVHVLQFPW